jgi:hypothetical protein
MQSLRGMIALGVVLCMAGFATAQPRPGPGSRGSNPREPEANATQRLEAHLDQLTAKLKDIEDKLARMQSNQNRDGDPRRGNGFVPPGPARFGQNGGNGFGPRGPIGMGPQGAPAFGRRGPDGSPGPGPMGPGPGGVSNRASGDFERRLDRIIEELRQLQRDVQNQDRRR